jgi:hypothetical protein
MSRRKNFNCITAVYTSPEEKQKIIEISERNNITQSEVMRLLLATYVPSDIEVVQTPKLI